ncbi:hypothetical protein LJC63_13080, partial [Ruminococcaceae bacterium OttesenSCG-928-L11]|nr:hypothetical protein [Ruminococcaceae bacterium OttesenSCG-928-L11]
TIVNDFTYGMQFDEIQHDAFDTFWKGFEGAEQLSAKRVEVIEGNLFFEIYFTQVQGGTGFTLSSVHISHLY